MRKVTLGLIDGDVEVLEFVIGPARVIQGQGDELPRCPRFSISYHHRRRDFVLHTHPQRTQ